MLTEQASHDDATAAVPSSDATSSAKPTMLGETKLSGGGSQVFSLKPSLVRQISGGPSRKCSMAFTDMSFKIKDKAILSNVSGGANSGEFLAILGSSGSGKTTLLDILANRHGRIPYGKVVSGSITFNGESLSSRERRKLVAYVAQDDTLMGGFTVRETLRFVYRCSNGFFAKASEMESEIDLLVSTLGLESCADVYVGSEFIRGISGGQRRRVSVAVEMISKSPILLLDEPTSGLDSIAALKVIERLKIICSIGHTVIATIHQPSTTMFNMFDSLLLLAQGKCVYFGAALEATRYFENTKFHVTCPDFFNPADFLVDIIAKAEESTLKLTIAIDHAVEVYDSSETKKNAMANLEVTAFSNVKKSSMQTVTDPHSSFWSNTFTLCHRALWNMFRNPGILIVRELVYITVGITSGFAFLQMGNEPNNANATHAVSSVLFFIPSVMLFLSLISIPFYMEERAVMFRETRNGTYSIWSYAAAMVIVAFPTAFLATIFLTIIVFFMVGLKNFGGLLLAWFLLFLCGEFFSMQISAISPHYILALFGAAAFWGGALVVCGFLIVFDRMSWVIRWLGYITPIKYGFRAMMRNQWQDQGAYGEAVLNEYELNSGIVVSFWLDCLIVFSFAMSYLVLFIIGLHVMMKLKK